MISFKLGKKLLAVVTFMVMAIGCFSYASASTTTYKASAEDKAAFDISDVVVSSDGDSSVSVSKLKPDNMDVRVMLFKYHFDTSGTRSSILYRVFGVYGIDEDDKAKVTVVNSGITSKSNMDVYQYNEEKETWRSISSSVYDGKMTFTLKKEGPIAITISDSEIIPPRVKPSDYVLTSTDKAAFAKADISARTKDDSKVGISFLNTNAAKVRTMARRFHEQIEKRDLFRVFSLKGGVDEDDGTEYTMIDYEIDRSSSVSVYQYNWRTQIWEDVDSSKGNGKLTFTLKKSGPIALTLPAGKSSSGKTTTPKVTSITLKANISSKTKVLPGAKVQFTATVKPDSAAKLYVTRWTTSNSKIATVDPLTGEVTAIKKGTVSIRAKAGTKSKTYKLKISPMPVSSITLNASTKTIKPNGKYQLTAKVLPKNATNKKIKWTSSNKKVATVTSKGKVIVKKKAAAGATCTITAKAKDGSGKYAKCKITVGT